MDDKFWKEYFERARKKQYDQQQPRSTPNNPRGKPTGDFTGRCYKCGSNDLWDDNFSYGCNKCGMIRCGG